MTGSRAGTWARFGIQQTPWVDFEENVYRYRFQGTVFAEREGYLSSSDAGASFRYNLPSNFGEVHVGDYNGENYNRTETNNQKAVQIRGTVRPFATGKPVLRGLRLHAFYDDDHYVGGRRAGAVHGERDVRARVRERRVRLPRRQRSDVCAAGNAKTDGQGYSIWATPKQSTDGAYGNSCCATTTLKPEPTGSSEQASATGRCRHRVLVPASGQRWRRRCSSITTVRRSATSHPRYRRRKE